MTDLDLLQKLIDETGIVQVTVMPPLYISDEIYSVVRKGGLETGYGVTVQEAYERCHVDAMRKVAANRRDALAELAKIERCDKDILAALGDDDD